MFWLSHQESASKYWQNMKRLMHLCKNYGIFGDVPEIIWYFLFVMKVWLEAVKNDGLEIVRIVMVSQVSVMNVLFCIFIVLQSFCILSSCDCAPYLFLIKPLVLSDLFMTAGLFWILLYREPLLLFVSVCMLILILSLLILILINLLFFICFIRSISVFFFTVPLIFFLFFTFRIIDWQKTGVSDRKNCLEWNLYLNKNIVVCNAWILSPYQMNEWFDKSTYDESLLSITVSNCVFFILV